MIYELLVGLPPFYNPNKHKMYNMIKEGKVIFPHPIKHKISVSDNAKDLILKLLNVDKSKRLGAQGVNEIL